MNRVIALELAYRSGDLEVLPEIIEFYNPFHDAAGRFTTKAHGIKTSLIAARKYVTTKQREAKEKRAQRKERLEKEYSKPLTVDDLGPMTTGAMAGFIAGTAIGSYSGKVIGSNAVSMIPNKYRSEATDAIVYHGVGLAVKTLIQMSYTGAGAVAGVKIARRMGVK